MHSQSNLRSSCIKEFCLSSDYSVYPHTVNALNCFPNIILSLSGNLNLPKALFNFLDASYCASNLYIYNSYFKFQQMGLLNHIRIMNRTPENRGCIITLLNRSVYFPFYFVPWIEHINFISLYAKRSLEIVNFDWIKYTFYVSIPIFDAISVSLNCYISAM